MDLGEDKNWLAVTYTEVTVRDSSNMACTLYSELFKSVTDESRVVIEPSLMLSLLAKVCGVPGPL